MFRDVVKGLARNASAMMIQQVVTWGSTFFIILMLPRYLGPVQWGWVFLGLSIYQIFGLFVAYGGSYLVAKDVARYPDRTPQLLVDAIAFRFIFSILSIAIIVAFTFVAGYSSDVRLIVIIYAISLTWNSGSPVLYAVFQGRELMKYTSAAAIVERITQVIVVAVGVYVHASVFVIVALTMVGNLFGFMVMLGFSRRIVPSWPRAKWSSVEKQMREGLPYFAFALFGVIYYRIDSLMLSKMVTEAVVGYYGAAYRFFDSLNVPYMLSIALYPVLARLWKDEEQTHRRTVVKSLELMILVAIPVTLGVIAFAENIVAIFYGLADYRPTVLLLQILTGTLIFLYVDMVLGTTMIASDRQKQMMFVSIAMIPVNVILNYFMISFCQVQYNNGALGAALATGLTEMAVMATLLNLVPKGVLSGFRMSIIPKGIVAGIVMEGVFLLFGSSTILWPVWLIAGSIAYLITLFFLRVLEPSEEGYLKEVFMSRFTKIAKHSAKP